MLDVLAIEVAEGRREFVGFRADMNEFCAETGANFNRIDRRLGNIETRVENIETKVEDLGSGLRSFRGDFERRIAPLER